MSNGLRQSFLQSIDRFFADGLPVGPVLRIVNRILKVLQVFKEFALEPRI